jgi:DNA-binding NarL/FixJ family response regulator
MIDILVIDDHPIVREGLVAVLEEQPELHVIGAVRSVEEALALCQKQHPDVALLDLELPGKSGIEGIPVLLEAAKEMHILIFSAYDSDERVFGALKAGAKGYLLKGVSVEEIVRAIHAVKAGGSYLEARVAARVVGWMGRPQRSGSLLSERERAVLKQVSEGHSNKQIAQALKITERTVKFHLTSIFTKLGADNRAQAVALAVQEGLL